MPAGQTLDQLVTALRAEIGDSTNLSMGAQALPGLQQTLRRVQETYYADFNWPHLRVFREQAMQAGERYYTFHNDVDFERIYGVWARDSDATNPHWRPIDYGITPEDYNLFNSDAGVTDYYIRKWNHYEGNQFEVWPVPVAAGAIRFRAMKTLAPLVAGTDKCDLDGTLLVLMAAAEMLARGKTQDAPIKLQMATSHYNRLKGRFQKSETFVMGGGSPTGHRLRSSVYAMTSGAPAPSAPPATVNPTPPPYTPPSVWV